MSFEELKIIFTILSGIIGLFIIIFGILLIVIHEKISYLECKIEFLENKEKKKWWI